jgi:hypothetical protein
MESRINRTTFPRAVDKKSRKRFIERGKEREDCNWSHKL